MGGSERGRKHGSRMRSQSEHPCGSVWVGWGRPREGCHSSHGDRKHRIHNRRGHWLGVGGDPQAWRTRIRGEVESQKLKERLLKTVLTDQHLEKLIREERGAWECCQGQSGDVGLFKMETDVMRQLSIGRDLGTQHQRTQEMLLGDIGNHPR